MDQQKTPKYIMGSDFDDTLYFHSEGGARKADAKAIEQFQAQGNHFGLVTGRSCLMKDLIDEMLHHAVDFDFMIYSNGAVICDRSGKILSRHYLPEEFVREVMEEMEDAGFIFHGREELLSTPAAQGRLNMPVRIVNSVDEFDPKTVYAISFPHTTEAGKRIFEANQNREDVILVANSRFADFNPKGVTKGRALRELVDEHMPEGTIAAAIGDSYNDLEMLKEADRSFTFYSSDQQVQDAATDLVGGIDEAIALLLKEKPESR